MQDTITQFAVAYFLPGSLAMITLAMGLGLVSNDFKAIFKQPKATIIGVIGQIILLPVLAFFTAFIFGLAPAFAVGLVLVASCPGGAHSNLFTHLAKGDVALSITLTAISGLICIVSIPAYVYLATQVFTSESEVISLPIATTIIQLLLIVIIPLFVGMLIKAKFPNGAIKLEKVVKSIAIILLAVIILGAVKNGWDNVVKYAFEIGLAIVFLNVSSMLLGLLIALKFNVLPQRAVAIMMEVGVQNTTLAFGIAMAILDSFMIAIPAMIYALWVYVTAFTAVLISRKVLNNSEELIQR